MGLLGWIVAAAAIAVALTTVVAYFSFPQETVITKTVKTDPLAGFTMKSVTTEPITAKFAARCEYWENRAGIIEGTVPPSAKDVIIVRCSAVETGGPVG